MIWELIAMTAIFIASYMIIDTLATKWRKGYFLVVPEEESKRYHELYRDFMNNKISVDEFYKRRKQWK
jgi:hypothetical protein